MPPTGPVFTTSRPPGRNSKTSASLFNNSAYGNVMRDQKRNSVEIVRVGAFSKELVSEETIYKVLKGLGFVPDVLARQAADTYWKL